MPSPTEVVSSIGKRTWHYALIVWVVGLISGLLYGAAKYYDYSSIANFLYSLVWIAGVVFLLCWAVLISDLLIGVANKYLKRS